MRMWGKYEGNGGTGHETSTYFMEIDVSEKHGKSNPITGPEGSRRLRLPDLTTIDT
jgi:hypothetical protein